jgi:hypothetical protein
METILIVVVTAVLIAIGVSKLKGDKEDLD